MAGDDAAEQLYALPLEEFTAARNELAKRLRTAGKGDEAAIVAKLAKPAVSAWVVNQIARRHSGALADLLDKSQNLREAQQQAVKGGDVGAVQDAAAAERRAVRDLLTLAEPILAEAGVAATSARLDRIADTLTGLSSSEQVREQARAGRLTEEVRRVGFGDFELPAEPAPSREARPDRERLKAERDADALQAKAERAAERAERLAGDAAEARQRADKAEQVAAAAAEEAEQLRREADRAGRALG